MIHVSEGAAGCASPSLRQPSVRAALLCPRQLADQDRDEDDVVDAENDFEKGEREQRDQPSAVRKASMRLHVIRCALPAVNAPKISSGE